MQAGRRNKLDPLLLVAITGAESQFGKQVKAGTHNPFGWGPHIPFKSWAASIDAVARGLRRGYLDEGRKSIRAIGEKWAPRGASNDPTDLNANWAGNVTKFYRELGGSGIPGAAVPPEALAKVNLSAFGIEAPGGGGAVADAAMQNLGEIAATGRVDPVAQLANLSAAFQAAPAATPEVGHDHAHAEPAAPPAPAADVAKWVKVPAPRGSSSRPHQQPILRFVGTLARDFGKPLTVWDNTTHSKHTVNGRVSAHYSGNAADIPARGAQLRRLGYIALVRAGMSPAAARKAQRTGGLFNVGGYQIIFATNIGGNHHDHLHVGIRG